MFDIMIGQLTSTIPYIIQPIIPRFRIEYITREISLVFLVRMVLNAWGIKEVVVRVAATKPKTVV
jgi:hypothetical protein